MAIRGVFTSNNSVRIKHARGVFERSMAQFTTIKKSKEIIAEAKAELGDGEKVFYHKNRDGTIAGDAIRSKSNPCSVLATIKSPVLTS